MKKFVVFILLLIMVLPNNVLATSGALKSNSIKTCPNGITYGYHGSDNHWHVAEKSNVKSGWSAVGDALPGDPCPAAVNNSTATISKSSQSTSTNSTSQSNVTSESIASTPVAPVEESVKTDSKEATNAMTETPKVDSISSAASDESVNPNDDGDFIAGLGGLGVIAGGTYLAVKKFKKKQ